MRSKQSWSARLSARNHRITITTAFSFWMMGAAIGLRDLCERRNVGYITRSNNEHSKAGNINHAFRQLSNEEAGEFVAILDADFVPPPGILRRALALFRDEKVGFLPTPHNTVKPSHLQNRI